MGAALALAIMLVVVVAVISLAVNAEHQASGTQRAGAQRGGHAGHPGSAGGGPAPKAPRRPARERPERGRSDKPGREPAGNKPPMGAGGSPRPPDVEQVFGDLRPLNKQASAVVLSVIDERTVGPVTRCRLSLKVEPAEGEPFEVTARVAFPTPEERAKVKVGAKVGVRYDSEDHHRVVVEMGTSEGS